MLIFLILPLLFSSLSRAEKAIEMTEVASAFTWIKIADDFPIVITSAGKDQISFRVFNDEYSITRGDQNYRITTKAETTALDFITVEKILKFVKAKSRSEAVLNVDVFLKSIKERKLPTGFQASKSIYQCRSDLPSRITQNGSIVNRIFQHTWIQDSFGDSFGMPNTDESTYFGGRAHIRSPDSFIERGPKRLECSPVWFPEELSESIISKKIECVTRSLSLPQNPIFEEGILDQEWVAHFDYHALEQNCLMAVRFALDCAGAKAPQVVNFGVGGKYEMSNQYSVSEILLELKKLILNLRVQLKLLRDQRSIVDLPERSEDLMNQALELDFKLRGVTGVDQKKSLREICDLALDHCNKIQ